MAWDEWWIWRWWCRHDGRRDIVVSFVDEAKIVEELRRRRPCWLEVPRFVKYGVMTQLHDARVHIQVAYVLIRRGEAEEDASEVVAI